MAKSETKAKRMRPAETPEGRENQLISLAVGLSRETIDGRDCFITSYNSLFKTRIN